MDFRTLIPPDERRAILEANIAAWARDGYGNQINHANALAIGDTEAADIAAANMATIATAIQNAQAELATL